MLDPEFWNLTQRLVIQEEGKLAREERSQRERVLEDAAARGLSMPSGREYHRLDEIQVDSIRKTGEIVWNSLKTTLEAFKIEYSAELAEDLKAGVERFFPLTEPQDYLESAGWKHPVPETRSHQRSKLELVLTSTRAKVHNHIDLFVATIKPKAADRASATRANGTHRYDAFISHASEDKEDFVARLADALQESGVSVWYDDFALKLGDSLRTSIDRGLASSTYGIVVLSHRFFEKHWPQAELSHPTTSEKQPNFPATGYTTITDDTGIVARFRFTDSPWVYRGEMLSKTSSKDEAKVQKVAGDFQSEHGNLGLEVRGNGQGRYKIYKNDEIYIPTITAELSVPELMTLTIELANELAQPTRENWDGRSLQRLIP